MADIKHKGTELNNVNETWEQNESNKTAGENTSDSIAANDASQGTDLEEAVKAEAAEYDNANKEDRLLGGERATVNDEKE